MEWGFADRVVAAEAVDGWLRAGLSALLCCTAQYELIESVESAHDHRYFRFWELETYNLAPEESS